MTLEASAWSTRPKSTPRASSAHDKPTTTTDPPAPPDPQTSHASDTAKLHRLLTRLQWRSDSLLCSWLRARDMSLLAPTHPHAHGAFVPTAASAETMFKLDFFEFYVLLERALVLALALVGTRVSRTADMPAAPPADGTFIFQTRGRTIVTPSQPLTRTTITSAATHRFHANLLATLDREDCPLHAVLGRGEARRQLGLAKEYRNRWKDADETDGGEDGGRVPQGPLDLPAMLAAVLGGLGEAEGVVLRMGEVGEGGGGVGVLDQSMEDVAPWEAVEDAMEWE